MGVPESKKAKWMMQIWSSPEVLQSKSFWSSVFTENSRPLISIKHGLMVSDNLVDFCRVFSSAQCSLDIEGLRQSIKASGVGTRKSQIWKLAFKSVLF